MKAKRTNNPPQKHTVLKPTLVALTIMQSINTQAATIHVGGPLGQGCGLSAAILSANQDITHPGSQCVAGDGDDIIELHRDITIRKSWTVENSAGDKIPTHTGMPLITSALTINGNGNAISRDTTAPEFRLLESSYKTAVSLNDISLSNGKINQAISNFRMRRGGAILAKGDLTISNSQISGNQSSVSAKNEEFDGSFNSINIIDSNFSNNSSADGRNGAAVDSFTNEGTTLYIKNSLFENNQGPTIRVGNYFDYNFGANVNIVNSSITNNSGVGISLYRSSNRDNSIAVSIDNTTISGNSGRGIDSVASSISITDSTISNNVDASCAGVRVAANGSIYSGYDAVLNISNSSISNNIATESFGGAVCSTSGGGYYSVSSSTTMIENSTLSGNSAKTNGGAIFTASFTGSPFYNPAITPTTLINTTISGNTAVESGGGIYLKGVAHVNQYGFNDRRDSRLTMLNTTISNNTATVNGGGIEAKASYLNFTNSIIAGNFSTDGVTELSSISDTPAGFDGGPAIEGSLNNLFGSSEVTNVQALSGFTPSSSDITATIDGTQPTQLTSIIQPLADNGGPTLTHALVGDSPAINAADNAVCNDTLVNGVDQRDEARDDAQCDIGSYELQANSSGLPSISVDDVEVSEDARRVVLRINLSEPQTDPVRVDYQTVDGTANDGLDYTGRAGSMTFAPGQTQKIRAIQLVNDNLGEDLESFSLVLSNPVGAELANSTSNINIIDDDSPAAPTINVEPLSASTREGNSRTITFRITLSTALTEPVSVAYETVDESATAGLDFVGRSGRMTFAIGQTSKIRSIRVLQDNITEPDETFQLELSDPVGAVIGNATATGTILDDD